MPFPVSDNHSRVLASRTSNDVTHLFVCGELLWRPRPQIQKVIFGTHSRALESRTTTKQFLASCRISILLTSNELQVIHMQDEYVRVTSRNTWDFHSRVEVTLLASGTVHVVYSNLIT